MERVTRLVQSLDLILKVASDRPSWQASVIVLVGVLSYGHPSTEVVNARNDKVCMQQTARVLQLRGP
jgi:hypothetical protein